jgi:hypothetical protein
MGAEFFRLVRCLRGNSAVQPALYGGTRIEAHVALGADVARPAREQGAAEQAGSDFHPIETPLIPLRADAGEAGLTGEEGKLDRLGQCFPAFGRDYPINVSHQAQ